MYKIFIKNKNINKFLVLGKRTILFFFIKIINMGVFHTSSQKKTILIENDVARL